MDSILRQAFLYLEQHTVIPISAAQKTYEQCCSILGLVPTPLLFPDEDTDEPP